MRAGDRRTLAGLVLVVLAVGVAVWLLQTADERQTGGAAGSRDGAAADLPEAQVPAVGEQGAPESLSAEGSTVAPTAPAPSPGEPLRFTGRVVDEAGAPVAGALVTHWPCAAFRKLVKLPRNPVWDAVPWQQLAATRTDAAGRFALDSRDIPPERTESVSIDGGAWTDYAQPDERWPRLLVEREGFGMEEVPLGITTGGAADAGDIVLHAGLVLVGRLVDPHGAGVADVALGLRQPERAEEGQLGLSELKQSRIGTRTDAGGRFHLAGVPFGPWQLSGEPAGFVPLDRDVRPREPGLLDLGDVGLDPGRGLAGQVLDEHGAPLAGAEVGVRMMLPMDGAPGPDRAAAAWRMRLRSGDRFFEPSVHTESDGTFVVQGLWPLVDSFRVTAHAPGYDAATAENVKPGAQDVSLALEPEATWRVLVADATDQRPVPDAKVEASRPVKDSEVGWAGDVDVVADGEDGWLLHGAGRWRTDVTVTAPGHATTGFQLDGLGAGESRQQLLLLPRELQLDGRVIDEHGAALAGAIVSLDPGWDQRVLGRRTATSAADGRFHVGQLGPATWKLTASAAGHVSMRRPRELVLAAGAAPPLQEIVLPAGGRIEGEVRETSGRAIARGRVTLTSTDPAVLSLLLRADDGAAPLPREQPTAAVAEILSGADGHFALDGLAPGAWELVAASEAKATAQVVAGATTHVTLVRRGPARLEGRVSAGGAPLVGVRVELDSADAMTYGWYPMAATTTDASGHYEFERKEGGRYAVAARDGEEQTDPAFVQLALDSLVHADLSFSGGHIAGRVTLVGAGTPLSGVSVTVTRAADEAANSAMIWRQAKTGADGRFAFERLPPGTWSIKTDASLMLAPELPDVQLADGAVAPDLSIEMSPAGALDLSFADPSGWSRVVLVELQPLQGQKLVQESRLPEESRTIGPIAPGDYVMNLKRAQGNEWQLKSTQTVTITVGQTLKLRIAD